MRRMSINYLKDESGQSMVEYGLIIGFIALAVIGALIIFGPQVAALFDLGL